MAEKKMKAGKASPLKDWKRLGPEAAYFQREAQVNFWTMMGGLSAGVLLTQIPALAADVKSGEWHLILYVVATLLVIVNSWVQAAWGSLVLRWRLTAYGTLVYFLGLFSLSLISLAVRTPALWMAAVSLQLIFSQLIQLYFKRSGAWAMFSDGRIRSFLRVNWIYIGWIVMTLAATAQMRWLPSRTGEIVWGLVALVSAAVALHLQNLGMRSEREELGIP